jgi:hypothetical protein
MKFAGEPIPVLVPLAGSQRPAPGHRAWLLHARTVRGQAALTLVRSYAVSAPAIVVLVVGGRARAFANTLGWCCPNPTDVP